MQDTIDALLQNLLNGPVAPDPISWNGFGEHAGTGGTCPLFKTGTMCQACCEQLNRALADDAETNSAFEDAYTRFRLTTSREVTRPVFRHLAKFACRRSPNNQLSNVGAARVASQNNF
ncbi:MAG: hypothetical protein DLM53_09200 [Candidatus Eremiobacter antarcticus]|nr:hypothetical protein [Candidatus Eremiobacteraeota bacterium]MBC5807552.1 hypothetical protein [Candidatus Eremiobacteraeota bacterium]PZR61396.1 MAG: hypothetical protein DLM53_09200 [Candidatus Eremiobacter sp. RRmetagenome_bin22]